MSSELSIGSATISNELRENPSRLDQMLSSIGSGEKPVCLVRVGDSAPDPNGREVKIGGEGFFWDHGVDVTLRGRRFALEWTDQETMIFTEEVSAFPFLLPCILSMATNGTISPLHACGVQVGNQGVLIAGPGGSGRTGLMLELVERGAGFLADDVCMVSERGDIISTGPHLTLHCNLTAAGLKDNLGPILKYRQPFSRRILARRDALRLAALLAGSAKGRIGRRIVRWSRRMNSSVRIDSRRLWSQEKWIQRCKVDKVLLCESDPGKPCISQITPKEAGNRLIAINRFELRDYLELLQVVSFAQPEAGRRLIESFRASEETVARSVSQAECFLVTGNRDQVLVQIPETLLGGKIDGGD